MAALVYLGVILTIAASASKADELFDILQARGVADSSNQFLGQGGGTGGMPGQPGPGPAQGSGLGKVRDLEERDAQLALDEEDLAEVRSARQASGGSSSSSYRTHVISRLNSVDHRISTLITVLTELSARLEATRQNVSTALDVACTNVRVRLQGGPSSSQGRVEISINGGAWGTVCQRQWDNNDATVVCRMLGYRSGTARMNAHFGQGTGNILLSRVNCRGSEYNIMQCRLPPFGVHTCGHHQDAGAVCV